MQVMQGLPLLIITHRCEQQYRSPRAHPQKHIAGFNDALGLLKQRQYHAIAFELDDQEKAGCDALESILAAELAGDVATTPLLLGCGDWSQAQEENRLRLKGFDRLLPLMFSDEQVRAISLRPEPDLHELSALAGHQQPVIEAMIPTLLRTLSSDLRQLENLQRDGSLIQIADLAHRMKSSFHLLGMRYARRRCITMERLPALLHEQRVSETQSTKMRHRFGIEVHESYQFLQRALGVTSNE
ncbi:Hpt domain-containing protein [Kosakonia oryzae]|uniref:Hpt domain-containing protein n=1 Tax=Kosakonia oryzae TaxID=497725 RepID=A0AA94GZS5_9ENTR|nr:Hpt domain-containing protein [Kosakonia oryzae]ANI84226.1 Hpt domain-containing protein [Kosakonia oryzae]UDJ81345.1 Hpt domain-containing protein [Kosakonia oryzae]SFB69063.1 Hpt domain-containing protein [Kosakonia oryzae]